MKYDRVAIAVLDGVGIGRKDKGDMVEAAYMPTYKEMLEKEKPELVAIATESGKHAQIAIDCLKLGHANLIIEKPIALSLADADKIISTAKEEGLKVCACHQNRFNKSIQQLKWSVLESCFMELLI